VLGNPPQANADGRQIVGRRLPVLSRRAIGWKARLGRLPEWIVDGGPFESSFLIANLEWKLLQPGNCCSLTSGIAQEEVLR
jgi:hypothetical protein